MNYPVWNVAFGAGLLIAVVAILHVFVSHFAVGGGLFLVVTERKARRNKDSALLEWLKSHTKFFVLVTVVFGVVSGVGIWFTIGLISPMATSNLIHAYVWGWAIEWIFFFVEITAALLYLRLGKAGAVTSRMVRMDIFHCCVRQHGYHQRHPLLYADVRKLGAKPSVLEWLF
jgi:cytochrome bd-type quinol oxidase subunit 1